MGKWDQMLTGQGCPTTEYTRTHEIRETGGSRVLLTTCEAPGPTECYADCIIRSWTAKDRS
jgi:hypothetical protein